VILTFASPTTDSEQPRAWIDTSGSIVTESGRANGAGGPSALLGDREDEFGEWDEEDEEEDEDHEGEGARRGVASAKSLTKSTGATTGSDLYSRGIVDIRWRAVWKEMKRGPEETNGLGMNSLERMEEGRAAQEGMPGPLTSIIASLRSTAIDADFEAHRRQPSGRIEQKKQALRQLRSGWWCCCKESSQFQEIDQKVRRERFWEEVRTGVGLEDRLKALSTQTEGNDQEQDTLATIPLHFPFKLSSLTIKLNGRCIPSFAFMKACFTALNRHPTSLRITTECGDNAFDFLVPHFSLIADTLHTLSIDLNCNESVGADRTLTNSVLPTLIGLQTLIVDMNSYGSLGRRAMDDDDYAIGEALVELGDFLPPNLRVIKIIKIVYGHFEAVKEFVEGSLPASVQHVFAILDSERMKGDYSEKTRDLAGEAAAKLAFEELGVVFLEDL
ncbi:hypothetical protein P7C70_g7183, partial [Phenoliferia sp. Uapishka_3]